MGEQMPLPNLKKKWFFVLQWLYRKPTNCAVQDQSHFHFPTQRLRWCGQHLTSDQTVLVYNFSQRPLLTSPKILQLQTGSEIIKDLEKCVANVISQQPALIRSIIWNKLRLVIIKRIIIDIIIEYNRNVVQHCTSTNESAHLFRFHATLRMK